MKGFAEQIINHITERFENTIAFLSGDIFSTIFSVYFLNGFDWIHPLIKVIMAVIVGFFGGFAGLMGKDFYEFLKHRYFK